MSKLIVLLAAGAVAVGGAGYGLYAYTDTFECHADHGCREVAATGGCCGGATDATPTAEADPAAVAVAGPAAAVVPTTPATASKAKPTLHACCADDLK